MAIRCVTASASSASAIGPTTGVLSLTVEMTTPVGSMRLMKSRSMSRCLLRTRRWVRHGRMGGRRVAHLAAFSAAPDAVLLEDNGTGARPIRTGFGGLDHWLGA